MEASSKYFDPSSVKVPARRHGSIWTRMLPWAYGAVALALVALVAGLFWPILQRNYELNRLKTARQQLLELRKAENLKLQIENHSLQSDPVYIERMARDVLNVGHEGETIFRFPPYQESRQPAILPKR